MTEFTCIGRICQVPELKETQSGLKYCNLVVRANRPYANADGLVESDDYSVTCWKQLAEDMSQENVKDKAVYIRGRLQANNFRKEEGNYYKADLIATSIITLPEE